MGSKLSMCNKIYDEKNVEGCKLFCFEVMNNRDDHKSKLMTFCDEKISLMGNVTADEAERMRTGVRLMSDLFFPSGEGTYCPSRPGPRMRCFCGKAHRGLCSFFVEGVITFLEKENKKDAYDQGLWRANPASQFEYHGSPPALTDNQLNSFKKGVEWADKYFQFS